MFLGLRMGMPSGQRAAAPFPAGFISNNLALWLRKGGASGSTWADSSGNGRTVTLNGSPTVGASSVTFDGATQWGTVTGGVVNVFPSDYTIYMRVKPITWAADAYLFSGQVGRASIAMKTVSPSVAFTDSLGTVAASTNSVIGAFNNISGQFNKTTGAVSLTVDGTTNTGTLANTNAASSVTIAAKQGGASGRSNIEVVEVIGYTALHTAPEVAQMIAYLNSL